MDIVSNASSSRVQQALNTEKNLKSVREAAQKFEAMFMTEMMNHMYQDVGKDNQFNGGQGEKVFGSMMIEQYGTIIAKSNQTGLSAHLEKQMLKMQEEQLDPRNSPNRR